jgi:predicted nucleotidyltransferase
MKTDIEKIIKTINPVLTRYGIVSASIVGSVARQEETDESDLDLIIEIGKPMSLLTLAALKIELEELLHNKVDLLERTALKPRLKQSILSNAIMILG